MKLNEIIAYVICMVIVFLIAIPIAYPFVLGTRIDRECKYQGYDHAELTTPKVEFWEFYKVWDLKPLFDYKFYCCNESGEECSKVEFKEVKPKSGCV